MSPESYTNPALAKLLTFSNYENSQSIKWYEHMNIIDLMKIAGYKTQWFSNQEAVSIWGNIPEVISDRAEIREFTRVATSLELKNNFDEKLLEVYNKYRVQADKEFHIFHLMGTHMSYANRFDKNNKI
nr:sulfatase-like hydrolase/transferase [Campylobacter sp. RM12175]